MKMLIRSSSKSSSILRSQKDSMSMQSKSLRNPRTKPITMAIVALISSLASFSGTVVAQTAIAGTVNTELPSTCNGSNDVAFRAIASPKAVYNAAGR